MSDVVHTRPTNAEWATCGAYGEGVVYGDVPTCVFCATNQWCADTQEIVRILASNSVKDIQEMEDLRMYQSIVMDAAARNR